jgi:hypothetical protein
MIKSISSKTTIKDLLEVNQDLVIEALIKLNKSFRRLKNPILRNVLARRVSIADACKMAGCSINDFAETMKQIGFTVEVGMLEERPQVPSELAFKQPGSYFTLDVRPILAQDKDPLKEILAKISALEQNHGLKLINTFEPLPLIHLLADRGFSHFTVSPDPGLVITYFTRNRAAPITAKASVDSDQAADPELFDQSLKKFSPDHIMYLDVRQLEMPKPMLTILERLLHLGNDDALFVYHKKIPVYLLPELEKQGFRYAFKDIAPGDVNMLIYKA